MADHRCLSSPYFSSPFPRLSSAQTPPHSVCIVVAGIGGSSLSHFLRSYAPAGSISSRSPVASEVERTRYPSGGSVIRLKNLHALSFAGLLNFRRKVRGGDDSSTLGIWDGGFSSRPCLRPPLRSLRRRSSPYRIRCLSSSATGSRYLEWGGLLMLMKMRAVDGFMNYYYKDADSRPVFETVEEMLNWAGPYSMTQRTLQEELADAGLFQQLISELVNVITRVNYGQIVTMRGLAGAVSLAGSDSGLWSIEGGNWQLAAGLINRSNAVLHLREEIMSIPYVGGHYELNSIKGNSYNCNVAVVATP